MRPYSAYDSDTCSIARTLGLIGDRWTLLVLRDVANGVRRFDELAGHLGVARNILASRLARLTEAGLVERTAYREPGARERHEYRLSGPGRELMPVLVAFMAWGDRNLAGPEGPPAVVRHADCGARIRVSLTCEEGHELGERPRLLVEPGPGSRVRSLPPLARERAVQAGPDGGVAFLFGRSAPYPVHLPGPYREVEALKADQAARADRLGLGHLGLAAASGRHWEEQVRVGGPARRQRLPLPAPGKLYQQKSEVMLLHDGSMTPERVTAPQAIRVISARRSDFL